MSYLPQVQSDDSDAKNARPTRSRWGLRAKAIYYLDRTVKFYDNAGHVAAIPTRFVVARDKHTDDLTRIGYQVVLDLDPSYRLLERCAPPPSARAAP